MKKLICLLTALLLLLTGCGSAQTGGKAGPSTTTTVSDLLEAGGAEKSGAAQAPAQQTQRAAEPAGEVDVDLTKLSSTMVYSEVFNMVSTPEDYVGKTVRMQGQCYSGYYDATDTTYYSVIIADATACCAQGLEYVLADGQEYPADESTATITGVFETYAELGYEYCHLIDARIEA